MANFNYTQHSIAVERLLDFILDHFITWEEFHHTISTHPGSVNMQSFREITEQLVRESILKEPLVAECICTYHYGENGNIVHHIFFENEENKLLFVLKYSDELKLV